MSENIEIAKDALEYDHSSDNDPKFDERNKQNLCNISKEKIPKCSKIYPKMNEDHQNIVRISYSLFSSIYFILSTFIHHIMDFTSIKRLGKIFSYFKWKRRKVENNSDKNMLEEKYNIDEKSLANVTTLSWCRGPTETLEDSIKFFHLHPQLEILEESLDDLRKNKKSKKDHEDCFKEIDKEIQKLSFKYHPDKVKNKRGTESEITLAQNSQVALNALRTALKLLNSTFIEDIGTDHHFRFYTNLSISSVCNEDEMKKHIYEVILKIGMISQIKQQQVISKIHKFLVESENCIRSFLAEERENFERARDAAFLHLKYCIKGFEKLCIEIQEVKKQCKSEENGENMLSVLQCMVSKSERDLKLLQSLETIAQASLKGKYQFFSPEEAMDPYFVLPFVAYTNVIVMCNVMVKSPSVFDKMTFYTESHPKFKNELSYLEHLYYLASYCSGNKYHERDVFEIMHEKQPIQRRLGQQISKEEIKSEFAQSVQFISEKIMECEFNVNHYCSDSTTNLNLKKCLMRMTEFQEKEKEVLKGFKEFQKKAQKMNEEHVKLIETMEAAEEQNQKVEERLEEIKIFNEMIFNLLSDQQ